MKRLLDDDIIGEIVVSQGGRRIRRSGEGVRDLVGLASDVTDVAGELADEEEVMLGPQGPGGGGVGLCDGVGQGFVIGVDDQFPALDEVLELPDHRSHGQVEGGIPRLRVGELAAEEGEQFEPPSMVLVEDPSDGGVGGVGGDRMASRRGCTRSVVLEMVSFTWLIVVIISGVMVKSFLALDRESVSERGMWARRGRNRR